MASRIHLDERCLEMGFVDGGFHVLTGHRVEVGHGRFRDLVVPLRADRIRLEPANGEPGGGLQHELLPDRSCQRPAVRPGDRLLAALEIVPHDDVLEGLRTIGVADPNGRGVLGDEADVPDVDTIVGGAGLSGLRAVDVRPGTGAAGHDLFERVDHRGGDRLRQHLFRLGLVLVDDRAVGVRDSLDQVRVELTPVVGERRIRRRHVERADPERPEGDRRIRLEVLGGDTHATGHPEHAVGADCVDDPGVDRVDRVVGGGFERLQSVRGGATGVAHHPDVAVRRTGEPAVDLDRAGPVPVAVEGHPVAFGVARLERRGEGEGFERGACSPGAVLGEVVGSLPRLGIAPVVDAGRDHSDRPVSVVDHGDRPGRPFELRREPGAQDAVRFGLELVVDRDLDVQASTTLTRGVGCRTPEYGPLPLFDGGAESVLLAAKQLLAHREHHLRSQFLGRLVGDDAQRFIAGGFTLDGVDIAVGHHLVDRSVPRLEGLRRVLARVVHGRIPDDRHDGRALRDRQVIEGNTEVLLGRRLDTVCVRTEEHRVDVELEDLILGEDLLELGRDERFADLALDGAIGVQEVLLHDLLCDRRRTAAPRRGGSCDRDEVDAAVIVEALVLSRKQGADHDLGDVVDRDRLAVAFGELAEQHLVRRVDLRKAAHRRE